MNELSSLPGAVSDTEMAPSSQMQHVTADTIFEARSTYDATISPDGRYVAFLEACWLPGQPRERDRIWVVETSGEGDPRPLSQGEDDNNPCWSPDSSQVAFISKVKGSNGEKRPQPFVISRDGGTARQLCSTPTGISDLSWSPDGRSLAFLSREPKDPEKNFRVGSQPHLRLWTLLLENDTPVAVTSNQLSVWEYAWSPDSQRFVVYYSDGSEDTDWYRGQLGVVPADGGVVKQISQLTRQASAPVWSPDGQRIAYTSGEWSDPGRGSGDLYVMNADGSNPRNLTPGAPFSVGWSSWLPDGQHLLYGALDGLTSQVGVIAEADGKITTINQGFHLRNYYWANLSLSTDGRRIAVTHSEKHAPDIWLGELTEHKIEWRRLTRLNPLLEETLELASNQRIRYESADGWQIEGILTLPLNQEQGKLPPLIVHVHGGPSGFWSDDWDLYRSQLLAANGFAVLRPNIRGSIGRGVTFADAVLGDMGGKDFQDILAGIDYLIAQGLVDAEKVGLMGWSYGGFMAAWAAVKGEQRFKAVLMGAGISDFHSFHAQSNIPDWDMRMLGDGLVSPQENSEMYRQNSPITYVKGVQAPVLIVHGDQDECVPVNQAWAFYRALREMNRPTELILYPDEGHGLRQRKHVRDYRQRTIDWFTKYLKR